MNGLGTAQATAAACLNLGKHARQLKALLGGELGQHNGDFCSIFCLGLFARKSPVESLDVNGYVNYVVNS